MFTNRLKPQHDIIFAIVRVPKNWKPETIYDVPKNGRIISQTPVASLDEALDDLKRCNELAIHKNLGQWAVVQTTRARA